MATWNEEESARRATLDRVGSAIAGELEGWEYRPPTESRCAYLVNVDGVTLWLSIGTYGADAGRLEIAAGLPDGASYSGGDYARLERPKVTVSPDRPAATLARDVARRLLPGAVDYWSTVSGRIADRMSAADARERVARELAELAGCSVWQGRDNASWQATSGPAASWLGDLEPDYRGDRVHVDVRVSLEVARKLAAILGEIGGEK